MRRERKNIFIVTRLFYAYFLCSCGWQCFFPTCPMMQKNREQKGRPCNYVLYVFCCKQGSINQIIQGLCVFIPCVNCHTCAPKLVAPTPDRQWKLQASRSKLKQQRRYVRLYLISFHFLPKSEKWNPFEINITYMPVDALIKKDQSKLQTQN